MRLLNTDALYLYAAAMLVLFLRYRDAAFGAFLIGAICLIGSWHLGARGRTGSEVVLLGLAALSFGYGLLAML